RAAFGKFAAADYRRGNAACASRSDRQRAWCAHDGDGFGDEQRRKNDRQLNPADEPGAPGFDYARADGNRRHGRSAEIAKTVIVKRARDRRTIRTDTNHEHDYVLGGFDLWAWGKSPRFSAPSLTLNFPTRRCHRSTTR